MNQEVPSTPNQPAAQAVSEPVADELDNPWRLALEASGLGVWDWHIDSGAQTHSRRWKEMLGFAADELNAGIEDFVTRLHPDDVSPNQQVLADYLHGRRKDYCIELRLRCKDGSWKWIEARGMVVSRDAKGQPLRMIGTHADIQQRKLAERELLSLNAKLLAQSSLLDQIEQIAKVGGWDADIANDRVFWTSGIYRMLETTPDEFVLTPETANRFFTPESRALIKTSYADVGKQTTTHHVEIEMITAKGRHIWVHSMGTTIWVQGRAIRRLATLQDITEQKQAQAALLQSETRWKLALESTGDGVWDLDLESGKEFYSSHLRKMYGYSAAELGDRAEGLDSRTHPDDLAQMNRDLQAHFDNPKAPYRNERRIRCKDGSYKWILSRGMVISRDEQGKPLRMIGTHTDISERKAAEALIWQQANFDVLTGLPNRRMLRDRLEQAIKNGKRNAQQLACLFIDLDHFKEVNDTLGHDQGDVLLKEAARRIRECVREADIVARMGGDEFTVILTDLKDTDVLEPILQKLLLALALAFRVGAEEVFVSASVGVTLYPLDANEIEGLFKNADQALYVAKGAGRNRYSFFTPALQEAALNRVRLANDLHAALTVNQLHVLYQPIVELASGAVRKAEALIRWKHPTRGLISPADFIPIAEASGLIIDIGEWVFQQVARQVQAWRLRLDADFQISVNKSPVQFQRLAKARQPWPEQLQRLGLPGTSIVVEITEGLLLDTSASVAEQLLELSDAGIQVSLDDFGTGYSSLSYLQKFDIDFIKIDQSFVRHLIPACTDLALCQAIIVMAHALGMKVIAEGVETEQERELLLAAGCDFGQGYLFSKPVAAAEFEAFVTGLHGQTS